MVELVLLLKVLCTACISHSTRQFYDRIAPIYDRVFTRHRVHAEKMIEFLRAHDTALQRRSTVLDLACGTGFLTKMLVDLGWETIGIDDSFQSLCVLRRNVPCALAIQADAASLALTSDSVDAVLCLGSWRHFPVPRRVAAEIARVLKEDGILIISYFPPALGGVIHVTAMPLRPLLARVYRTVTKIWGYSDRVDEKLQSEAVSCLSAFFGMVTTVPSGEHWTAILAQKTSRPARRSQA